MCLLGAIFLYHLPDYSDYIIELNEKKWGDFLTLNLGNDGVDRIENANFDKLKEYCYLSEELKDESNPAKNSKPNILPSDFNFSINDNPGKEVIVFINSMREGITNIDSDSEIAIYIPDEFCAALLNNNMTTVGQLKEEIKNETKNKITKLSSYAGLFFAFSIIFLILAAFINYIEEQNLGKSVRNISKYWVFTALPLACFCVLILAFGPKLVLLLQGIPILNQVTDFYYLIHLILEPIAIIYIIISIMGVFGWLSGFGIPLKKYRSK